MPTYSQIQSYRGKGLTFREIGEVFGITRQRAHSIFTGYDRYVHKKSTQYLEYKRHFEGHNIDSKPRKHCGYCL